MCLQHQSLLRLQSRQLWLGARDLEQPPLRALVLHKLPAPLAQTTLKPGQDVSARQQSVLYLECFLPLKSDTAGHHLDYIDEVVVFDLRATMPQFARRLSVPNQQ